MKFCTKPVSHARYWELYKLLFIDNYDSFTYNVVHLLSSVGAELVVMLNDDARLTPQAVEAYRGLVVGPGPGNPSQQPRMMGVLRAAIDSGMPVLGVCLGLQAIGEAVGAKVTHAPQILHGKTSSIEHDGSGIFAGLPSPFIATRYHSLCLDPASLPSELVVTARSSDGVVQGVRLRGRPVHGVQFHPESVLSEHGEALFRNFLSVPSAYVRSAPSRDVRSDCDQG